MELDDLILVSVDDHVVEPPNVFDGRLPAKYVDVAPKLVRREDGTDAWLYGDEIVQNLALNAVAGRPPEEYGFEPTSFDQIRPGTWNIDDRIKDMDANGVLASLNFPSFPQFCGQLFARTPDKDVGLAMIRAYNDWHIDEWAGTHPGRIIPCALPVMWDAELMAEEVRRVADKGCHAVTFSENPMKLGYPSLHSETWDPFWAACEDVGTVPCLHIGSSSSVVVTAPDAPVDVMITLSPMNIVQAAADLIWSPVLRKFPNLRLALSEGGIGWIPYFLERIDYVYQHHKAWTFQDFGGILPSQMFKERIVTCFIDDNFGVENRHHLNLDNITWECDYPHSDSTWPQAPELVMKHFAGVSDAEINKITHENALRIYSFDAFSHVPREHATVGALRARAAGHDVALRSVKAKPAGTGGKVTNAAMPDIMKPGA